MIGSATMVMKEERIEDYVASYYGTKDRHEDLGIVHKLVSQVMGADLAIAEFHDENECDDYCFRCSQMKTLLADMKKRVKTWDLSQNDYKRELKTKWIPLADEFMECWGEEMVPHYLRVSIHEVRMKIQQRVVGRWPVILMLWEDGTLVAPTSVDHLGRIAFGDEHLGESVTRN
jgi:hypothetical protein